MSMSGHIWRSLLESNAGFESPAASENICTYVCSNRGVEPRDIPRAEVTSITAAALLNQHVKNSVFHTLDGLPFQSQICEANDQQADMQSVMYTPCECIKTLKASIHLQGVKISHVLHNTLRCNATYCNVGEGIFRLGWRISSSSVWTYAPVY